MMSSFDPTQIASEEEVFIRNFNNYLNLYPELSAEIQVQANFKSLTNIK